MHGLGILFLQTASYKTPRSRFRGTKFSVEWQNSKLQIVRETPPWKYCKTTTNSNPIQIHVWYIYLHLPWKSTIHVGKYTSPMDPMGTLMLKWTTFVILLLYINARSWQYVDHGWLMVKFNTRPDLLDYLWIMFIAKVPRSAKTTHGYYLDIIWIPMHIYGYLWTLAEIQESVFQLHQLQSNVTSIWPYATRHDVHAWKTHPYRCGNTKEATWDSHNKMFNTYMFQRNGWTS